jgi:hypothetical protein
VYLEERLLGTETFSQFCERNTPAEIKKLMNSKGFIETKEDS